MKILNLIIKKKFYDAIVRGKKTTETREVRPSTEARYVQLMENGSELCDDDGRILPVEYDAIRFYTKYDHSGDSALVEVLGAEVLVGRDADGLFVTYDYNGETYFYREVVYTLGKVLERKK